MSASELKKVISRIHVWTGTTGMAYLVNEYYIDAFFHPGSMPAEIPQREVMEAALDSLDDVKNIITEDKVFFMFETPDDELVFALKYL